MSIWKDENGGLHDDMDGAALDMASWPSGLILLTDAEVEAMSQPTEDQLAASAVAEVQRVLDAQAQGWGYDDLKTAVSYLGDPCARFNAEAVALRDWRSAVWVWAGEQQAAIAAGTLAMPASVEAFVAGMPAAPSRPTV